MSNRHRIILFGAGKIGEAIAGLLGMSGRYQVLICDQDLARAQRIARMWANCEAKLLDLSDPQRIANLLENQVAALSALPFHCNISIAKIISKFPIHYFDLTEDVETTKAVRDLSKEAQAYMMPQCGLAPGFISIAAAHLAQGFDQVDTLKLRVGALPIYPSNRLKYNLTWSTEGIINQYGNMCELIDGGVLRLAFALEGYERLSLDGVEYEAFNTSGGLGTLCDTFQGRVRRLDYKSVRYPGHRDYIAFLMQDLRFNEDRETLRLVFERSISFTAQDKCLIFVEATGHVGKRLVQKTYASTVYNTFIGKHHFGAIQLTTAAGICAPMDLVLTEQLKPKNKFIQNEEIPLEKFLANEFGKHYSDAKALQPVV